MSPSGNKEHPGDYMLNERGVTLMEMVIYVALAGMLLAAAVTAFLGQNKSYNRQDIAAGIQQNVRGGLEAMIADIRFAGLGLFDQTEIAFEATEAYRIAVNYLEEGNLVRVHYRRSDENELQRAVTNGGGNLLPGDWATLDWETLAENIEQLRFEYLYDRDPDVDDEEMDWAINETIILNDPNLSALGMSDSDDAREKIIAVKMVILGGARASVFNQTDPATYDPPIDPVGDANDPVWLPDPGSGYKQMVSVITQCRNNLE